MGGAIAVTTLVSGCATSQGAALEQEASTLRIENRELRQELADVREELATLRSDREALSQQVLTLQTELDRARGVRR